MQRSVGNHVVGANVQQRQIKPEASLETGADMGDRPSDPRTGNSYVHDVGVRIVGGEQAGDRLLGQPRTDADTGAVAENQQRRALRRQSPLEALSGLGEPTRAADAIPEGGGLEQRAGQHQQQGCPRDGAQL
jgi:hypothetical protein